MAALSVWKSIYKYPLRNTIYVLLLSTAFSVISLLLNTIYVSSLIQEYLHKVFLNGTIDISDKAELSAPLLLTVSSLMPLIVMIVLLCIAALPFIHYLFCIGKGYETGVLRALGLSKGRAWARLVRENVILVCASLFMTWGFTIVLYKSFARSMLSVESIEKVNTRLTITGNMQWGCLISLA